MKVHARTVAATTILALGACLTAAPTPAAGQTVATTLGQLDARLSMGTTVVVETVDGRKIKGPVRRITESEIVFDKVGQPSVSAEAIRTVSARTGHRPALRNVVIWMAIGASAGVGYLIYAANHEPPPCAPDNWFCGANLGPTDGGVAAVISLIGAGVGAGVGAMLPPPMRVVYRAPSPARVSIAPFITPQRRGIAISVAF